MESARAPLHGEGDGVEGTPRGATTPPAAARPSLSRRLQGLDLFPQLPLRIKAEMDATKNWYGVSLSLVFVGLALAFLAVFVAENEQRPPVSSSSMTSVGGSMPLAAAVWLHPALFNVTTATLVQANDGFAFLDTCRAWLEAGGGGGRIATGTPLASTLDHPHVATLRNGSVVPPGMPPPHGYVPLCPYEEYTYVGKGSGPPQSAVTFQGVGVLVRLAVSAALTRDCMTIGDLAAARGVQLADNATVVRVQDHNVTWATLRPVPVTADFCSLRLADSAVSTPSGRSNMQFPAADVFERVVALPVLDVKTRVLLTRDLSGNAPSAASLLREATSSGSGDADGSSSGVAPVLRLIAARTPFTSFVDFTDVSSTRFNASLSGAVLSSAVPYSAPCTYDAQTRSRWSLPVVPTVNQSTAQAHWRGFVAGACPGDEALSRWSCQPSLDANAVVAATTEGPEVQGNLSALSSWFDIANPRPVTGNQAACALTIANYGTVAFSNGYQDGSAGPDTDDRPECQRCDASSTCFTTVSKCFLDAALQVPSPWPCIRVCGRYDSTFVPPLEVVDCAFATDTQPRYMDDCSTGVPANVSLLPANCAANSSFSRLGACIGDKGVVGARGCLVHTATGASALASASVKQLLRFRANRCLMRAADRVPVVSFDHTAAAAPTLLLRLSTDDIAFTTVIRSGKSSAFELFGRFGGAISLLLSALAAAKVLGMGAYLRCASGRGAAGAQEGAVDGGLTKQPHAARRPTFSRLAWTKGAAAAGGKPARGGDKTGAAATAPDGDGDGNGAMASVVNPMLARKRERAHGDGSTGAVAIPVTDSTGASGGADSGCRDRRSSSDSH